jgi:hypothetical protein
VVKVIAVTIVGYTDHLAKTLEKAGFRFEHSLPNSFIRNEKAYDMNVYGLFIGGKGN